MCKREEMDESIRSYDGIGFVDGNLGRRYDCREGITSENGLAMLDIGGRKNNRKSLLHE